MANKTQVTCTAPSDFIAAIEHPLRRADAETLIDFFGQTTGMTARMWGPSIIGFGKYH